MYRSNLPQSQLAIAKDDNLDFQDTKIFSKSSHLKVLKGPRKRNGVSACPTAWLDASDPCRSDSPLAKLDQGTLVTEAFFQLLQQVQTGAPGQRLNDKSSTR